jgi:hypothetical protein
MERKAVEAQHFRLSRRFDFRRVDCVEDGGKLSGHDGSLVYEFVAFHRMSFACQRLSG